jgi:hypothetical protein
MKIILAVTLANLFVLSSLASASPKIWIDPLRQFDGSDVSYYTFLAGISDDPGMFRCIETTAWENSPNRELKHIYLQSNASSYTFANAEGCEEAHKRSLEADHPGACVPMSGYSFDYFQKKCLQVSTRCGPEGRMRAQEIPNRFFMAIYQFQTECESAPRNH